MGKQQFFRAVALTLGVLLCLCGSSCAHPGKEEHATRAQSLTVEASPTAYTPAFSAAAAQRGAALFGRVLAICDGATLDEEQLQRLALQLEEQLLPRLEALSVHSYELTALLEKGERICTMAEESGEAGALSLFLQFYQAGLSVLSSQTLGGILFSATEWYLSRKTQQCRERYETYGYQWYLEDANRYDALRTQLCSTLGEEAFAQMTAMAVFALSLGGGAVQKEEGSLYALSDEELTVLLRRQADYFCSAALSGEMWSVAAQIYTALFSPQGNTPTAAVLSALFRSGYGAQVAQCMPTFLELYRAVAQSITPQQLAVLRNGGTDALPVVARLLCDTSAEVLTAEQQLELYGYSQSKEEESALHAAGLWEEYQQYLQDTPTVRASELLESAEAFAAEPSPANRSAFLRDAQQSLRTYLPCLSFVLSRTQR